jgi:hypothetical protein
MYTNNHTIHKLSFKKSNDSSRPLNAMYPRISGFIGVPIVINGLIVTILRQKRQSTAIF